MLHQLRNGGRARGKYRMYFLHHVDIVHTLMPGKRKSHVFKISDGVLLPVHIIRAVSPAVCDTVHAVHGAGGFLTDAVVNPLGFEIGGFFHGKGMNRQV